MHVIEDSRRFARSKGNALRGVTFKVSPKRLTLYHFRVSSQCQGSSHSRLNLLRSKDVVFVSCVWLLQNTTQYGSAESNPTETPIVYRFTQKKNCLGTTPFKELIECSSKLGIITITYFNYQLSVFGYQLKRSAKCSKVESA